MATAVMGVPELDRVFRELKKSVGNRIAGPAIRRAASFGAKKVKAAIPSRYKGVRKATGWRSMKTKYNGGFVGAKVGAGVGKKKATTTSKDRTGRKGVGFDARNIHWWFMGTAERETGTKRKRVGGKRGRGGWKGTQTRIATGGIRRRTGRMPPQTNPVQVILRANASGINEILRTWIDVGIKKEAARAK